MDKLEHAVEACTGNWRLSSVLETRMIRCEACAVAYPATPVYRLAAIDENYAGIYLRRLSDEGASLRWNGRE
ncbi:MAG TPA: hypothetical protein VMM83_05545 [Longimicrobiales bacterium]|nr:hypothetical protein [Longimicrobiales bacterium]